MIRRSAWLGLLLLCGAVLGEHAGHPLFANLTAESSERGSGELPAALPPPPPLPPVRIEDLGKGYCTSPGCPTGGHITWDDGRSHHVKPSCYGTYFVRKDGACIETCLALPNCTGVATMRLRGAAWSECLFGPSMIKVPRPQLTFSPSSGRA